jgi:hypothetical protein
MRRHRTLGKVMVMYIKAPTSGCEPASRPGQAAGAYRPNGRPARPAADGEPRTGERHRQRAANTLTARHGACPELPAANGRATSAQVRIYFCRQMA